MFKSIRKDGEKSPTSVLIKNFGTTKDSLEIKKLQKKALLFKQEMTKQNPKAKSFLLRTGSDIIYTIMRKSMVQTLKIFN